MFDLQHPKTNTFTLTWLLNTHMDRLLPALLMLCIHHVNRANYLTTFLDFVFVLLAMFNKTIDYLLQPYLLLSLCLQLHSLLALISMRVTWQYARVFCYSTRWSRGGLSLLMGKALDWATTTCNLKGVPYLQFFGVWQRDCNSALLSKVISMQLSIFSCTLTASSALNEPTLKVMFCEVLKTGLLTNWLVAMTIKLLMLWSTSPSDLMTWSRNVKQWKCYTGFWTPG